jgi:hypothetical protein
MIAGEGIQDAKEVTAGGGVDDLIYPRERIRILGTCLVETCEIHAEAPTAISLWDNHRIGDPGGVGYLAYYTTRNVLITDAQNSSQNRHNG